MFNYKPDLPSRHRNGIIELMDDTGFDVYDPIPHVRPVFLFTPPAGNVIA